VPLCTPGAVGADMSIPTLWLPGHADDFGRRVDSQCCDDSSPLTQICSWDLDSPTPGPGALDACGEYAQFDRSSPQDVWRSDFESYCSSRCDLDSACSVVQYTALNCQLFGACTLCPGSWVSPTWLKDSSRELEVTFLRGSWVLEIRPSQEDFARKVCDVLEYTIVDTLVPKLSCKAFGWVPKAGKAAVRLCEFVFGVQNPADAFGCKFSRRLSSAARSAQEDIPIYIFYEMAVVGDVEDQLANMRDAGDMLEQIRNASNVSVSLKGSWITDGTGNMTKPATAEQIIDTMIEEKPTVLLDLMALPLVSAFAAAGATATTTVASSAAGGGTSLRRSRALRADAGATATTTATSPASGTAAAAAPTTTTTAAGELATRAGREWAVVDQPTAAFFTTAGFVGGILSVCCGLCLCCGPQRAFRGNRVTPSPCADGNNVTSTVHAERNDSFG